MVVEYAVKPRPIYSNPMGFSSQETSKGVHHFLVFIYLKYPLTVMTPPVSRTISRTPRELGTENISQAPGGVPS